jgi:hypothetical protein
MRFISVLFGLLVTGAVSAQGTAPAAPTQYSAHIQLTSGKTAAADQTIDMVGRQVSSLQGTASDDANISYRLKLTPFWMPDGYVGLRIDAFITTKGPEGTVTSGGAKLKLPSTAHCESSLTGKVALGKPTTLFSSSGVNDGGYQGPIPGCSLTVTLSEKPQG